jgi:hypothetical protein
MDQPLCQIGPTPAQGELRVKMSQSSLLEHLWCQFKPASPVLNLAKKEWTASKSVDCFKMHGIFCRISQALAQGDFSVKMSQSSVLQHV